MTLNIELTDVDADLVNGFAVATGWNAGIRKTKEEWLNGKTDAWIRQQAMQGMMQTGTQAERDAYLAKLKTVQAAAIAATKKPPVINPKNP